MWFGALSQTWIILLGRMWGAAFSPGLSADTSTCHSVCPTSAHPKRSWVDHLFACWRQPRTSEATNLHLVIRRLPSSATNWYTWLLWRSAMSNFRFFWGEPSTLWGHHRSTPLKINVSLLKLNLIQTIWYFLAWVTDYCWNSYQI